MTSMDRAKRFLSQKSRAIAFTIVPLAGLVISQTAAKAATSISSGFSPGSCNNVTGLGTTSLTSGGCAQVLEGAVDPASGLQGVKLYSTNGDFSAVTAFTSSGGTYGMEFTGSGTANVSNFTGSAIPVSWDFSVHTSDLGPVSYTLTYSLFGQSGLAGTSEFPFVLNGTRVALPFATLPENGIAQDSTTVIGSDFIRNLFGANITGYSIDLQLTETAQSPGQTMTVTIPTNSLDLAESSTPEPASIFLFGSGFAGLLLHRLRRARQ